MIYDIFLVIYIHLLLVGITFSNEFIPFGRYEYYFGDQFIGNYEEATDECLKQNARLVIIYTEEINNFIRNRTSGYTGSFFIGLQRVETARNDNSAFFWIDGTSLTRTFSNWDEDEPNNRGFSTEKCVEVVYSNNFTWNDEPCGSGGRKIVCQRRIQSCNSGNPCGKNSYCDDSTGNIRCICNRGYKGDGFVNCTDIDECEMLPNTTCADCICKNTPGSFIFRNVLKESAKETDVNTESRLNRTAISEQDCRDEVNDADGWMIVVLPIIGLIIVELVVGLIFFKLSKNRKKSRYANSELLQQNGTQQDDYTELNLFQVAAESSMIENDQNQNEDVTYDTLNNKR